MGHAWPAVPLQQRCALGGRGPAQRSTGLRRAGAASIRCTMAAASNHFLFVSPWMQATPATTVLFRLGRGSPAALQPSCQSHPDPARATQPKAGQPEKNRGERQGLATHGRGCASLSAGRAGRGAQCHGQPPPPWASAPSHSQPQCRRRLRAARARMGSMLVWSISARAGGLRARRAARGLSRGPQNGGSPRHAGWLTSLRALHAYCHARRLFFRPHQ